LGIIYYKKDQLKEALEYFEKVLQIRAEKLKENQQAIQEVQVQLFWLLMPNG
jgi:DNA-binding protein H-NS